MKRPVGKPAFLFKFNQAAAMLEPTIPGPDPDTKTPKFKLPALATDAHCHIFGPHEKYPYSPDRPYTPPDCGAG